MHMDTTMKNKYIIIMAFIVRSLIVKKKVYDSEN